MLQGVDDVKPASQPQKQARKLPAADGMMDLKRFMLRSEVLRLYRHILRELRGVPNPADRKRLVEWARQDFELNRHLQDDYSIKLALSNGRKSFDRLSRNILRSR